MCWLLGKRGGHVGPQALSEYLDGRLSPSRARRVETHLTVCVRCRDEVESLRRTVGLLRRLPRQEPPRSFVLLEPPVPARPPLRVPAWAYGAAASAFALAFAVILSVDLAGVLAPSMPVEPQAAALPTPVSTPAPEAFDLARGAPQVTPTPPPLAPKEAEAPQAPPATAQRGTTSWVWRLVEGLLAGLALAGSGAFFIWRRRGSLRG